MGKVFISDKSNISIMVLNSAARKRKQRFPKRNPNNPNYAIQRAKMEKKRELRNKKRIAVGKNPIANPLTMVLGDEQVKAYKDGKLLLMDGNNAVKIPLGMNVKLPWVDGGAMFKSHLQGVYKLSDGKLVVLRTSVVGGKPALRYFVREGTEEKPIAGAFDRLFNIAHMSLQEPEFKGRGLGVRAALKAEKEYRVNGGKQPFFVPDKLIPVFKKMGYASDLKSANAMSKRGKMYRHENMQTHHVIEAIDPITGKIKPFPLPIKK
jgi:hypothetical protein